MKKYNYKEEIKKDIKIALAEYVDYHHVDISDLEYDEVFDELWFDDSVTGNGSGSYTFNIYQAEENLIHNNDLLSEAIEDLEADYKKAIESPEYADVIIRCYLLPECLNEVIEESKNEE